MAHTILPPDVSRTLTFGVEIECILLIPCIESDISAAEQASHMKSSLDFHFLNENCQHHRVRQGQDDLRARFRSYGLPVADAPSTRCSRGISQDFPDYTQWHVVDDSSVSCTKADFKGKLNQELLSQHLTVPTEVVSRTLPATMLGFDELNLGLMVLHEFHPITNTTTGLHVHVGDGPFGLSTKTLKNLVAIMVGFEDLFNTFHPKHRKFFPLHEQDYCKRLSKSSGFYGFQSNFQRVQRVFATTTRQELIELVNPGESKYFALNIVNPLTVEFRQHTGCTGPRAIRWAKFCIAMVDYARKVTDAEMGALLTKEMIELMARKPLGSDLFNLLNCKKLAEDFKNDQWHL